MKMVKNAGARINKKAVLVEQLSQENPELMARIAMIQTLIPIGLGAVEETLQEEVLALAGPRYNRSSKIGRHGSNSGSVYVYDQKVKTAVPRMRHKLTGEEVSLKTYAALQQPQTIDVLSLSRMVHGISSGNYEATVLKVPETLGLGRNAVSKRWIRSSAKKLRALQDRDLSREDFIAIFVDGKAFSREKEMVVAVGVTIEGRKVVLGFVETSSENHRVVRQLFQGLKARGLRTEAEILFVIDGSKGIRKAIEEEFSEMAFVQRCLWHKREDILSYLSENDKGRYRSRLQAAYEQSSYQAAKEALLVLRRELAHINISAARSLDEGFEETLTLHRLGLFSQLGTSLKTTNVIENINKLIEMKTGRVNYWKNSDQRQRWVATALLTIEPNLRVIKGFKYLPQLRAAMKQKNDRKEDVNLLMAA